MEIRFAEPSDDTMAISRIIERSWKFAYKGIIPQSYLDAIPEGRWAPNINSPKRKTLVCVEDGKMVGTCSFSESRLERFPGWGEVISIYLLPEHLGKGYGKKLMESAVSELREQGYENIFLWVLEENARAIHFYEEFGFSRTDDFLEVNIGGKDLREVRYIYPAREAASQ